jgi:HD-like signal output (HDOD) protein
LLELPPFPAIAIKALQMASTGEMRLRELHEVISTDPAFSAELLKIANSPLYGIRTTIKNTLQASMLLGYVRLKRLVLTVGIRGYLVKMMGTPGVRLCWRHSLACAIVAEDLVTASFAAKCDVPIPVDKDFAFTAGIIHDVGRLALAVVKPKQYAELLRSTQNDPCNLAGEQDLFGANHCEIGRYLVVAWNLPKEFIAIASQHHNVFLGRPMNALEVIQFSCMMANVLGFHVTPSTGMRPYEALLGDLPEGERQYFRFTREEYAAQIARRIDAIESA